MTTDFWTPLLLSVEIAAAAGSIVFAAGLLLGKAMSRAAFKGKIIVETVFLLPLVLPPTVVGFLLIVFFGMQSPAGQLIGWLFQQPLIFTWGAAVTASVVVAFPLMYQSAKAGFEAVDADIEAAARVDGAGERQVFFLVSIPLALRMIITGGVLSFARALGEFGATFMFAGNIPGKTQTVPIAIYLAMESGNMLLAWLWTGSVIALSFFMLIAVNKIKTH